MNQLNFSSKLVISGFILCLAFLTFFSIIPSGADAIDCLPHSYTKCYGTAVYWYDSCNMQQDLYQSCVYGQICSGNACITQNITNTNNTNTNANYIAHNTKGCVNNISYWYDSLGSRKDVYQNCSLTGQSCQEGQCVGTIIQNNVNTPTSANTNTDTSANTNTNTSAVTSANTTAAVSISGSPFTTFVKTWYLWFILALVLIVVFVIIFRRLSSNSN